MPIIGITASSMKGAPGVPTIGTVTDVGTGRAFNNGAAVIPFTAAAGATATSFTVKAYTSGGSYTGLSVTGASSPLTLTGLASSTQYQYKVFATNASGSSDESSFSNLVTTTTVPQAPTIGTAIAGNASATVTYTANATGGKTVTTFTATSSPGSLTGTGASPITVSGLTNGTAYTFTVTATNANGTSAASAASNSVTPVNPASNYFSLVNSPSSNYGIFGGGSANSTANYYSGVLQSETPSVVPATLWSYNKTGGINWQRKFIPTAFNSTLINPRVEVSPNGNIIIVAKLFDNNAGTQYPWMASINPSNGSYNWQQTYTSDNSNTFAENSENVYIDSSNNIYAAGTISSQSRLYKFNSSGAILWSRRNYQQSNETQLNFVAGNGSNRVYTASRDVFRVGKDAYVNTIIVWWNDAGSSSTRRRIGGTAIDWQYTTRSFIVDPSGNVFAGGLRQVPTPGAAIIKMDFQLNILVQRYVNNNFSFSSMATDSSGNIYAAGGSASVLNVFKFDNNLNLLWQRYFANSSGLSAFNNVNALKVDEQNNKLIISSQTFNDGIAMAVPTDGSGTGTYTFANGKAFIYGVQSFTVSTPASIATTDTTIGASVDNSTRSTTGFGNDTVSRTVNTITF